MVIALSTLPPKTMLPRVSRSSPAISLMISWAGP